MSLIDTGALSVDVLSTQRLLLMTMQQCGQSVDALSPGYLALKLAAAEKQIARALRIPLEPTEVLPDGGTQQEQDAFNASKTAWREEPSYEMTREFFRGDSWGFIAINYRPLIQVHDIRFVYPEPFSTIWTVPSDWVKVDRRYAHVRLVPGSQAFVPPLFSWAMQTVTGGRVIPHMIHVRYKCGLADASEYPDLLDVIYQTAVLGIIDDQFLPQSGSDSVDGISQSISWDPSKHQDRINKKLDLLKKELYGLVFGRL